MTNTRTCELLWLEHAPRSSYPIPDLVLIGARALEKTQARDSWRRFDYEEPGQQFEGASMDWNWGTNVRIECE